MEDDAGKDSKGVHLHRHLPEDLISSGTDHTTQFDEPGPSTRIPKALVSVMESANSLQVLRQMSLEPEIPRDYGFGLGDGNDSDSFVEETKTSVFIEPQHVAVHLLESLGIKGDRPFVICEEEAGDLADWLDEVCLPCPLLILAKILLYDTNLWQTD